LTTSREGNARGADPSVCPRAGGIGADPGARSAQRGAWGVFGGSGKRPPNVEVQEEIWSSEQGSMVDASEPLYEEGRGKLREAAGRSTHPGIRG
jgi:hypothetical protein